jgi:2-dehydro-3-deoxyphosphogalactonate aldolase
MNASVPWPKLKRNLVAILRGIKPEEVEAVGLGLAEAGFEAIEIPLNSPDPLKSIAVLVKTLPPNILIGAGTVLSPEEAEAVHQAGGRLMVSPNVDELVIRRASALGMVTMPGVFTPTEAFAALKYGASALKFFPASVLGAGGIAAIKAVLSQNLVIGAVGGVSHENFAAYAKAGVTAFGLGSSLYKPGVDVRQIAENARMAIAAYEECFGHKD